MKHNRRQINLWGIPHVEEIIVPAMPYMGSKRKLANKILNAIYQTVGDFDTIYDLFGGGGAMSIAALRAGHEVFYNEKNQAVVELLKHILRGNKLPNRWISREEYKERISGSDWFAGFLLCCWSFGQKYGSYLFGTDIERLKQLAHNIVIDRDILALQELNALLNCKLTMPCNRLDFKKQIRASTVERLDLQRLQQLEQLQRLQQLEQLQRLQRLECLERLQQLESLNISCGDYNKIEIKSNAVIYCDPPYSGTGEYKDGAFDSVAFWQWCREQTKPVFISEYKAPNDFAIVAEFEHRSTLSSTNNAKFTIEKIFWNERTNFNGTGGYGAG